MQFISEIKEILRLDKLRLERRINLAEFLASANRILNAVYLDGQVNQLRELLLKDGGKDEDRHSRV